MSGHQQLRIGFVKRKKGVITVTNPGLHATTGSHNPTDRSTHTHTLMIDDGNPRGVMCMNPETVQPGEVLDLQSILPAVTATRPGPLPPTDPAPRLQNIVCLQDLQYPHQMIAEEHTTAAMIVMALAVILKNMAITIVITDPDVTSLLLEWKCTNMMAEGVMTDVIKYMILGGPLITTGRALHLLHFKKILPKLHHDHLTPPLVVPERRHIP